MPPKYSFKDLLKKAIWFYYDGIAFFGFADHKLARARGQPASVFDKFLHPKTAIMWLVNFCILIWILSS